MFRLYTDPAGSGRPLADAAFRGVGRYVDVRQYTVIERFASGRKAEVYERFHQKGRMLPDGLTYLDSWLEKDGDSDAERFIEFLGLVHLNAQADEVPLHCLCCRTYHESITLPARPVARAHVPPKRSRALRT